MQGLVHPILVTTLGLAPGAVGAVLMVRGLWDALTDPVMGFLTDNARTRMGRRRPFVLCGGILMGVTMILAWLLPVGAGPVAMLTVFGVAMLAFATAQTIYSVPYGALGLELSLSYDGRTRVQMAKALCSRIASFASPFLFPFCLLPIFASPLVGAQWLSVGLAILMAVTGVIAALATRERVVVAAQKDHFLDAIRETLRSPHFLRIAFIYVVLLFVLGAFGVFSYFLGIYYVFRGDVARGAAYGAAVETLANVLALAAIPAISGVCAKFGKHNALRLALALMIFGSLLQLVLLNPDHPWLMFISPFFYSVGIVATFMVLGTMLADVVDADELETDRRREGLFSATAAFMMKTVGAVATGLSGLLIEACGFEIEKGANQAPGVFTTMLILFSGKCILLVACLVVLHGYPLTRERVAEIQAELRRRGELPAS